MSASHVCLQMSRRNRIDRRSLMGCWTVLERYGAHVIMGEGSYAFALDRFVGDEDVTGDSSEFVWMDAAFIEAHAETLVFCPKTNIIWAYQQSVSAALGAWLSGMTKHHGVWAEAWYVFQTGPARCEKKQKRKTSVHGNVLAFAWCTARMPRGGASSVR